MLKQAREWGRRTQDAARDQAAWSLLLLMLAHILPMLRLLCLLGRMTSTSSSYGGQEAVGKHLRKASGPGAAA